MAVASKSVRRVQEAAHGFRAHQGSSLLCTRVRRVGRDATLEVAECRRGLLERDAMGALVPKRLRWIPFEVELTQAEADGR